LALLVSSCDGAFRDEDRSPPESLIMKLEGTWKMDGAEIYEHWKRENGSFSARVFIIDVNDTITTESIRLEKENHEVFYRVLVLDQNRGEEVSFRMVRYDSTHCVFENPDHDFPTRIEYHFPAPDSMSALISGQENGQDKEIKFFYVRQ
jgi:hypothetical protein